MTAKDLLNRKTPVLQLGDPLAAAYAQMSKLRLNCLPVIVGPRYAGLLRLPEKTEAEGSKRPIEESDLFVCFVHPRDHILGVLDKTTQTGLDLLPVVTTGLNYVGCVTKNDLLNGVATLTQATHPGATLLLEMPSCNFSPTHLASIVEDCGGRIIHLLTHPNSQNGQTRVLLKIEQEDGHLVAQSLERYDYTIIQISQREETENSSLKQRLNELMFYLEM